MRLWKRRIVYQPEPEVSIEELSDLRAQFRECLARLDEIAFEDHRFFHYPEISRMESACQGYALVRAYLALRQAGENREDLETALVPLLFAYLWHSNGTDRTLSEPLTQEEINGEEALSGFESQDEGTKG